MLPYGKSPMIVKRRKGDATGSELLLLAQAYRTDGVVLEHARGHEMPAILRLAFEVQEQRGWFSPPGPPEIRANTRYFTFSITEAGRRAYRDEMAKVGLER
jgi:hypothetical protein